MLDIYTSTAGVTYRMEMLNLKSKQLDVTAATDACGVATRWTGQIHCKLKIYLNTGKGGTTNREKLKHKEM